MFTKKLNFSLSAKRTAQNASYKLKMLKSNKAEKVLRQQKSEGERNWEG